MTQPAKESPASGKEEAPQSTPVLRGEAVKAAEGEPTGGALPDSADGSDAVSRRLTGDEHGDDDQLDHDLEDKALVEGVEAANETAQIARALTPHNF